MAFYNDSRIRKVPMFKIFDPLGYTISSAFLLGFTDTLNGTLNNTAVGIVLIPIVYYLLNEQKKTTKSFLEKTEKFLLQMERMRTTVEKNTETVNELTFELTKKREKLFQK